MTQAIFNLKPWQKNTNLTACVHGLSGLPIFDEMELRRRKQKMINPYEERVKIIYSNESIPLLLVNGEIRRIATETELYLWNKIQELQHH